MSEIEENKDTAQSQDESDVTKDDITSEFNKLGENLRSVLHTAWESEERKNLQGEIETGFASLGSAINKAIDDFDQSSTGHAIKSDIEDLKDRYKTGEVEAKVRQDVLTVLQKVNDELKNAVEKKEPDLSSTDETE
jgi:hypothetical protein